MSCWWGECGAQVAPFVERGVQIVVVGGAAHAVVGGVVRSVLLRPGIPAGEKNLSNLPGVPLPVRKFLLRSERLAFFLAWDQP